MLGFIGVEDGGVAPRGEGAAVIRDLVGVGAEENRGAVGVDPDGHEGFGLFFGGVLGASEFAGFGDKNEGDGLIPGVGILDAFAVLYEEADRLEVGDGAASFLFNFAAGGVKNGFVFADFTAGELDIIEL